MLRCAAASRRCGVRKKYASLSRLRAPCLWSFLQSRNKCHTGEGRHPEQKEGKMKINRIIPIISQDNSTVDKDIKSLTSNHLEKLKQPENNNTIEDEIQSAIDSHLKQEKQFENNNMFIKVFVLLFFGLILAFCFSLEKMPNIAPLFIIIFPLFLFGFPSWAKRNGYWIPPTKEELEANKKANEKRWSEPIKSAHIIRLERGLYTGLGNRRPYPHGRRTKKY